MEQVKLNKIKYLLVSTVKTNISRKIYFRKKACVDLQFCSPMKKRCILNDKNYLKIKQQKQTKHSKTLKKRHKGMSANEEISNCENLMNLSKNSWSFRSEL